MKRNAKIIQIAGFRGILTAIFVVTCLAAGFVAFPGLVAMTIWNKCVTVLPQINLLQGILLWAMVALICYIANNQRFAISFESPKELTEEEMDALMQRVRLQSQAKILNQIITKNIEELKKEEEMNSEDSEQDIVNK